MYLLGILQIAAPICSKYEQNYQDAIDKMNGIVHQQPSDKELETLFNLIVGQISGIPKFDESVPCTDTQYRIDFPLMMLYPQTHNPIHGILINRENYDFLNVPFLPVIFCK